jgi:hypothetical protein
LPALSLSTNPLLVRLLTCTQFVCLVQVNTYGSHNFIVVPFFRLSQHSRLGMETMRKARRNGTRESHYHYQHGHNHVSHRTHGDASGYKKDRGEAGKNSLDEPLEVEVSAGQ